jgi:hypothetical protein
MLEMMWFAEKRGQIGRDGIAHAHLLVEIRRDDLAVFAKCAHLERPQPHRQPPIHEFPFLQGQVDAGERFHQGADGGEVLVIVGEFTHSAAAIQGAESA